MKAIQNSNFPFITVTSGKVFYGNEKTHSASMEGPKNSVVIYQNDTPHIIVDECTDLVYHMDVEAAKAYRKELEDAWLLTDEGKKWKAEKDAWDALSIREKFELRKKQREQEKAIA